MITHPAVFPLPLRIAIPPPTAWYDMGFQNKVASQFDISPSSFTRRSGAFQIKAFTLAMIWKRDTWAAIWGFGETPARKSRALSLMPPIVQMAQCSSRLVPCVRFIFAHQFVAVPTILL